MFLHNCRTFLNSLLSIKDELLNKMRKNYLSKLHSIITYILMSQFKVNTGRRKTSFRKETLQNADLHQAILNKTMTAQE